MLRACDLTSLEATDTPERVAGLAARAVRPDPEYPEVPSVAAVCVHTDLVTPVWDALSDLAAGSRVRVAAACGAFPHGRASLRVKLCDIADAVAAGADELDVVMDRAALLSGRHTQVADEIAAMRAAAGHRTLKVIIESGELASLASVRDATWIALQAGADFVKTSTGKSRVGATPEAVQVLCETVRRFSETSGEARGIKVSGGVRTVADALTYTRLVSDMLGPDALTPSRFRIGASTLVGELVAARRSAGSAGTLRA
jgi:deoxyribose-phosphate aldolase